MTSFTSPHARRLRVVQASFHVDVQRRSAESLLDAWPTLPAVASAAHRAGIDVNVVLAAHRRETLERDGVTYQFMDDPHPQSTHVLGAIGALSPDVVHVQGLNFPRAMGPLARAVPGVPILVQDHGSVLPSGWRASAWRWAHRSLAAVAFTSRDQAIPWKRAKILRDDLPVFEVLESSSDFMPGDRDAARRSTGMFGGPCLLWTGSLDTNKDPLTTLSAFERAAPRLNDARLFCCFGAGSPLLGAVTERIALSEVLRDRVVLLGERPHEEMEIRFRAADFFVQTSHREGSGYSLLEALACGTTPLVTDIPASRQIVGDAGSLTPVGDVDALADAMVAWSGEDRGALRRAARARFDAALTFDAVGRQLRGAYEALAGMTPSDGPRTTTEWQRVFA